MFLLKATLVLAIAAVGASLLRRSPAIASHRLWTWTFAAMLALPLLTMTLPALHIPVPETFSAASSPVPEAQPDLTVVEAPKLPAAVAAVATPLPPSGASSPGRSWAVGQILGAAWLMGAALGLVALVVSLVRVHRLATRACVVDDSAWQQMAATISSALGLRIPVRLLTSDAVTTPMAGGFWRPAIFLPPSSADWDEERREVVLAHELAHVAARDHQRHLVARVAVSLYWFHPLAWFAARQATAAREAACDERVLALGTRPSTYARVLLDLADAVQAPPRALATLPMVHRTFLEARVMAILNGTHRPSAARRGLLPVLGITSLTLLVAAVTPGATALPNETLWVNASPSADIRLANNPSAPLDAAPLAKAPELRVLPQETYKSGDCWGRLGGPNSFSGSITSTGTLVSERVGSFDDMHRVMLFSVDGTRLCVYGEALGRADANDPPSRWIGRAKRVVLESSTRSTTHSMVFTAGSQQPQWQVNGVTRNIDRAAEDWRSGMLATLDAKWEATVLRGEQTSLRGEITSIRGEETSLRGEITSLRGEVTSMRGRITSIRGEETSMRGRITSIRGHETSLRGQITSARGAITSINAGRYSSADADRRIGEYERQIEKIEKEIRDYDADAKIAVIEKEIEAFNADRKAAEIEKQIEAFDLEKKVAEIERRIAALEVSDKVKDIEDEIGKLDAERKVATIEKRLEQAGAKLKTAIAAIR